MIDGINENYGGLIMWLIFGSVAVIATFLNLYLYKTNKNNNLAMAVGLSFTALTLVAQYGMVSEWVNVEDWSALLDVVPTMGIVLWFLTITSILLNVAPTFLELKNKK